MPVKELWKSDYIRISYDHKSEGLFLLERGVQGGPKK